MLVKSTYLAQNSVAGNHIIASQPRQFASLKYIARHATDCTWLYVVYVVVQQAVRCVACCCTYVTLLINDNACCWQQPQCHLIELLGVLAGLIKLLCCCVRGVGQKCSSDTGGITISHAISGGKTEMYGILQDQGDGFIRLRRRGLPTLVKRSRLVRRQFLAVFYFEMHILNNTFIIVLLSVVQSRLPDAGYRLMFHSTFDDNENILVCTFEGDLREIGSSDGKKTEGSYKTINLISPIINLN